MIPSFICFNFSEADQRGSKTRRIKLNLASPTPENTWRVTEKLKTLPKKRKTNGQKVDLFRWLPM